MQIAFYYINGFCLKVDDLEVVYVACLIDVGKFDSFVYKGDTFNSIASHSIVHALCCFNYSSRSDQRMTIRYMYFC